MTSDSSNGLHMCDPIFPLKPRGLKSQIFSNPAVSPDMTDIESGRPPKATRPLLFPPYLEEPSLSEVPKVPAPPSTTTSPNGTAGITMTPSDTMFKINIGDVQDQQVLDSLPQAPFFSMATLFKPFTFSRPSSAENVAAFLPPGPDRC